MKHSVVDKSHIPMISKSDRDLLQLIDDNTTSSTRVWSSSKIVRALTADATAEGGNSVSFNAIAATPLDIETTIVDAPASILLEISSSAGKQSSWNYTVPVRCRSYQSHR